MPDDSGSLGWLRPQGHDFMSLFQRLQQRDRLIVSQSLERIARSRELLVRLQVVRPPA